ncbi:unnamed protein product, partial [Hymenolepis diminuta]
MKQNRSLKMESLHIAIHIIVVNRLSLMNNLEIINPDANSEYFSGFHGMRARRECLDIFINTKEVEEVGAHLIVLSASFPVFGKHLRDNAVVHVQLLRFSHEEVNAAVEYAHGGIENISPEVTLRLFIISCTHPR